jgi:hypothetical protein
MNRTPPGSTVRFDPKPSEPQPLSEALAKLPTLRLTDPELAAKREADDNDSNLALEGVTGMVPPSCCIVVEHDHLAAPLARAIERLLRNGYTNLQMRQLPRRKKGAK